MLGVYPDGYQPYMTYDGRGHRGRRRRALFDGASSAISTSRVSFGQNETGRYTDSSINPSYGPDSPTQFLSRLVEEPHDQRDVGLHQGRDRFRCCNRSVLSSGALYRHEYWGTADLGDAQGYTSGPLGGRTTRFAVWSGRHLQPVRVAVSRRELRDRHVRDSGHRIFDRRHPARSMPARSRAMCTAVTPASMHSVTTSSTSA